MNEARLAVRLVERYGLSTKQALKVVLEDDADAAAKMVAKKEAPEDPKKQKDLEKRYKEDIQKDMDKVKDDKDDKNPFEADDVVPKGEGDDPDEDDANPDEDDANPDEDGDDASRHESRRRRR